MNKLFKEKANATKSLSGFDSFISKDITEIPPIKVPISELYEFKNHPFRVIDEDLEELIASIKEMGVMEPAIVRTRKKGGYEIISGHRRKRASELAGLTEIPVRVMDISDDEATILMVDSNLHREVILPSEKAKAYSMKYEHMKHQGKIGNSLSDLAESTGEGTKTIQRYIYLARLNDTLLTAVDENKVPFMAGVELSFLSPDYQVFLADLFDEERIDKISVVQASMIRAKCKDESFMPSEMVTLLLPNKEEAKPKPFKFKQNRVRDFFSSDTAPEQIEDTIYELLDVWKKHKNNALFKNIAKEAEVQLPGQMNLSDLED